MRAPSPSPVGVGRPKDRRATAAGDNHGRLTVIERNRPGAGRGPPDPEIHEHHRGDSHSRSPMDVVQYRSPTGRTERGGGKV